MSPAIKVDFTDTVEKDFEAVAAGWYLVTVTGGEMRATQDKPENKLPGGTPMINWEFTICSDDPKLDGKKVWTNTIIYPTTLFNLKGLLRGCGMEHEGELDFEIDDVIGKQLYLKLIKREYPKDSGDYTNDVKGYKALDDAPGASSSAGASLLP
jgi:hypothetical protein